MVKWPFLGWLSDLQRLGIKRSRIESPGICPICIPHIKNVIMFNLHLQRPSRSSLQRPSLCSIGVPVAHAARPAGGNPVVQHVPVFGGRSLEYTKEENKNQLKSNSRWFKVTFLSPNIGGHLTPWKGHLTIPKRSLWITRMSWFGWFLLHFVAPFRISWQSNLSIPDAHVLLWTSRCLTRCLGWNPNGSTAVFVGHWGIDICIYIYK